MKWKCDNCGEETSNEGVCEECLELLKEEEYTSSQHHKEEAMIGNE